MTALDVEPIVVRDLEQLVTLPSWCVRWSEDLGAWLYFAPPA